MKPILIVYATRGATRTAAPSTSRGPFALMSWTPTYTMPDHGFEAHADR